METDPPAADTPRQPAKRKKAGTGTTRADGTPKAPKATNAEVLQRVEEVLRLKLDGAQFHDIVQYASEKGWAVGERQIREYMGRADDLLRERQERKRSRLIAYHRAARRALFARALQAADFRTALACLDAEAKLVGLFPDGKGGEGKAAAAVPLIEITVDDEPTPAAGQ